ETSSPCVPNLRLLKAILVSSPLSIYAAIITSSPRESSSTRRICVHIPQSQQHRTGPAQIPPPADRHRLHVPHTHQSSVQRAGPWPKQVRANDLRPTIIAVA